MLKAIFYARFHTERGPVKLIQCPTNVPPDADGQISAPDFQRLSSHVIPPYALCNRALDVSYGDSVLLGWPVSIEDERYTRNRFTFNVCFVVDRATVSNQRQAWSTIVKKTARWFRTVEEDSGELSQIDEDGLLDGEKDASKSAHRLQRVIEQVFDQLNTYGECCARLSEIHVLNIRLDAETPASQQEVHAWDVPLMIATLREDKSVRPWDLVLQRTRPHINGISHLRKISMLADVELDLALDCVSSLIQAGAVMLLDIFHFQAIYEPTQDVAWFVQDADMQEECSEYIAVSPSNSHTSQSSPSKDALVDLYLSLNRGTSVADFCLARQQALHHIDVRRFITFGIIKGFLRRVHKYARATDPSVAAVQPARTITAAQSAYEDAVKKFEDAWKQAALSSGWATPPSDLPPSIKNRPARTAEAKQHDEDAKLAHYLDGRCCFDQICLEMGMSEKRLMGRLESGAFGEVIIFTR